MAIPININDLINRRVIEGARIEYKANWNPEPVLHTICAFANDTDNWGGGYIVLGIEEQDGLPRLPISGITKSSVEKISRELLNVCNLIEPRYIPVSEHFVYNGKDLLVLWVPGGSNRPYKCPERLSAPFGKSYYIRRLSSTIKANAKDVQELFALSETIPYDDRINPKADVEDLRPALIINFLHEVQSGLYEPAKTMQLRSLALDLRIAEGPAEYFKPLNVGLMFFNDRPDNYFRYARIEVVDKPDETGTGMTEKIFTGPLDRQLRDALAYIRNYIIKEKIVKHANVAEAERIYNFPYAAVEEGLSNAVHHKDYQVPEPITVTVTPEKMEILSFPGPDRSISDESIQTLRMVATRYRNRRIGEFLKELRLVEGRNTGIPSMLRALAGNGSALPLFETDDDRSYFRATFLVHSAFVDDKKNAELKPTKRKKKADVKAAVLEALATDILSSQELAAEVGYSTHRSGAFYRIVNELVEEGKIAYTNPDKLSDSNQKIYKR
ncbi:MAG: putative DNA binding domain-containing protein [Prevotellaceae bacterium]|jgi:ATP-dependent DNA helicase RecG|nr:putative DNA binding domain-containing protein [Prevotellaceae bacterium]